MKVKNKALLISFIIILWFVCSYYGMQNATYETNDDNAMAATLYGVFGDSYDYHLVFVNAIIGHLLIPLLKVFPNIPWYTVAHGFMVILAIFVIFYLLITKFDAPKALIPIAIFAYFFCREYLLSLQFSKTAGLSVMAGLLLLFDTVALKKQNAWLRYLTSAILVIFGSMFRFVIFKMLLIPMFVIGLVLIEEPLKNHSIKEFAKIALPFLIIFSVCFGAEAYNSWILRNEQSWSDYMEFDRLRSAVMDYGFPDYNENIGLYESLDISQEDLIMYKSWDFADTEIFNTEALKKLVAAKSSNGFDFWACIKFLSEWMARYNYSATLFIALLFAFVSCKKVSWIIAIYEILAFVFLGAYIFSSGRYNINRVDINIFALLFLILVLYCWDAEKMNISTFSALMLSAWLIVIPFIDFTPKIRNDQISINDYIASDKDNLYVSTTISGRPNEVGANEIKPIGYLENLCALGGWKTQSPLTSEQMSKYGIENPFRDIVDNENVYLLCAPDQIDSRLSYIQRHYSPDAQAQLIKLVDSKYYIYRITTHGPRIDTSHSIAGEDFLKLGIKPSDRDGVLVMDGYLVMSGINSYKANLYLGITNSFGKEQLQYLKQHELPVDDIMNGLFSGYSAEIDYESQDDKLRLYLEIGTELYHYDLGSIADILQAGPSY